MTKPRQNNNSRLQKAGYRYQIMAESAPVILWMADSSGNSFYFNHHWREFTGAPDDVKLDGDTWYKALHPEDRSDAVTSVKAAFAVQQDFEIIYRLRRHDGEYRWMLDSGSPNYDEAGDFRGYVGASIDVTERQQAEQALEQSLLDLEKANQALYEQSVRDPLTQCFNRRYFSESLDREIKRAAREKYEIGVLMIDIDHFKPFNDNYGHQAGDAVLQELARCLTANMRAEDVVSRYGGEEFSAMLPGADETILKQRATRLCQETRSLQVDYAGQTLPVVTISIGGAVFPKHGSSSEELIRVADEQLYAAKAAGRDQAIIAS